MRLELTEQFYDPRTGKVVHVHTHAIQEVRTEAYAIATVKEWKETIVNTLDNYELSVIVQSKINSMEF